MTAAARTVCPVCDRDVAARRDGTPRAHNPPPGRADLRCSDGHRATHCRGSHETPTREVLKVRAIGGRAQVERFASFARTSPDFRVIHDSGLIDVRSPGQVRLYMELEATDAQK